MSFAWKGFHSFGGGFSPSFGPSLTGGITPIGSWDASTSTLAQLAALVSHSRTSLATMFDSTGKLTYAPNNLALQNNTFNNATWTKSNVTVTTGVSDPFGGTAASTITATSAGGFIVQNLSAPTGAEGIVSVWIKRRTGSGAVSVWDAAGTTTAITSQVTGSWQLAYVAPATITGGVANAFLTLATSGDAVDVYLWTTAAVTYETSPRAQDQVITTAAAYYGPRVDYDPNTLAVKGLLIEGAATNLAIQSGALSGASWAVGGATKSTDGTLYLNGATATKITATTINNNHSISSAAGVTVTSGQTYTQSILMKAGAHSKVAVNVGAAANWAVAVFDISGTSSGAATQTGAGSDTSVSGVSTYLGGGWFRLALTFTASATGSRFLEFQMVPATTGNTFGSYGEVVWLAAGTETVYVGQPQLETGSFATSYIPTSSASVARASDALTAASLTTNPAIIQLRDIATGTRSRKVINPWSGISSETNEWIEAIRIYPSGTSGTYLNTKLTVDGPW